MEHEKVKHLFEGNEKEALCGSTNSGLGTSFERTCLVCQFRKEGWPKGLDEVENPLNVASHIIDLYSSLEEAKKRINPDSSFVIAAAFAALITADRTSPLQAIRQMEGTWSRMKQKRQYGWTSQKLAEQAFTDFCRLWRKND